MQYAVYICVLCNELIVKCLVLYSVLRVLKCLVLYSVLRVFFITFFEAQQAL